MIPRNSQILLGEREMMSGNTAHAHDGEGGMHGVSYSQLLAPGHADVQAVQPGAWSNPATWGGALPVAGQNIHIPQGRMVIPDIDDAATELGWIRNDGGLIFPSDGTARFTCDTILNTLTSYLEIGNPTAPASAQINWVGGAMDPLDMMEMGRGLLTIGRVMIHGRPVIPYAMLPQSLPAGSPSFTLPDQYDLATGELRDTGAQVAATWRVGDKLYFERQTNLSGAGAETATIQSISGATVTLTAPLQFNQTSLPSDPQGLGAGITMPPGATFPHRHQNFVINETRSVVFRSLDPSGVRGHSMFMHGRQIRNTNMHFRPEDHIFVPTLEEMGDNADPGVHLQYFAAEHMGRSRMIKSPKLGDPGNHVGRYSVHAHRLGHWAQKPVLMRGIHVHGNIGWGITRHDSHALIDYCSVRGQTGLEPAGVNGGGAGMIDEEDTELGAWTRCIVAAVNGDANRPSASFNNEDAFNGHGQGGDAFAVNRNAATRELIALNCRDSLHIHPPNTNTRKGGSSILTYWTPVDRRADIEGLKRTTMLTNPIAAYWNEDNQPPGWYAMHTRRCSTGLKVFHRQRPYTGFDFHVHIKDMVSSYGRPVDTENYVLNYLFENCSWHCNNSTMWKFGDKAWGMVFVRNLAFDIGPMIEENWGTVTETYNVGGGLADNVFMPRTTTAWPANLAFDTTNHDSSGWGPYTFDVSFLETPYQGAQETVKAMITDGFTGNVPLHLGRDPDIDPLGPRPMGYGRQGLHVLFLHSEIRAPGVSQAGNPGQTDNQLVYTHGCFPNETGGHSVRLWWPYRDRLTAELHWVHADYDVSHLPLEYRQKYEVATAPGHSTFPELPPIPQDEALTSYNVFLDPTHPVIYIEKNGRIQIDATEAFLDLPAGESATWTRTVTRASGQTETIEFTVPGRAYAPSQIYALPEITRREKMVQEMPRGADQFAVSLMHLHKGKVDGWPAPYTNAVVKTSLDGKATWADHPAGLGVHDFHMPSPTSQVGNPPQGWNEWGSGHYRQEITYENTMGALTVPGNTVFVNTTNGNEVAGETWDVTKPTTVPEPS